MENSAYNAGRALLTSTNDWPNGARVAIGLEEAGCAVFAVCIRASPFTRTRAVRRTFSYSGLRPMESLESAIRATRPQLILPCDEPAVEHLHELHARAKCAGPSGKAVEDLIERSLGRPDSFVAASTRYALMDVAFNEGLRVPDTALIREISDFGSWRAQHEFPWVLKVDGTSGGEGVRIAHTLEEAERGFISLKNLFRPVRTLKRVLVHRDLFALRAAWKRREPAIIVQRYIPGRAANCAVACWRGRILACIAVEVLSSQGSTGPASVVRVIDNPEMLRCAERIGRRLGSSGFFGLDFVLEAGTGAAFLLEMNPRCAPPCHLQLGRGHDPINALWTQVSGHPAPEKPPVTQNEMIAYFPNAWAGGNEYLDKCFQDIPHGHPELIQALLRPRRSQDSIIRAIGRTFGAAS